MKKINLSKYVNRMNNKYISKIPLIILNSFGDVYTNVNFPFVYKKDSDIYIWNKNIVVKNPTDVSYAVYLMSVDIADYKVLGIILSYLNDICEDIGYISRSYVTELSSVVNNIKLGGKKQ